MEKAGCHTLALGVGLAILLGLAGCVRGAGGDNGSTRGSGDSGPPDNPAASQPAGASTQRSSDAYRQYPLDSLPTATIRVNEHTFRVWVVRESDRQRPYAVQEGLMYVPAREIADDQGMLFVFDQEEIRGFWMHNTITPLDIAFARSDGTIVKIWQMPPLTLQTFSSVQPAMFALEVKQGTFSELGIREGDRLDVSADLRSGH